MKEVEAFEITFNDIKYTITIYSILLNHITAYFAVAHDEYISQKFYYKDHNQMVYYFTQKEDLKNRLELFIQSLNVNSHSKESN